MQGLALDSRTTQTGHALILNEYGWLWLDRDGSQSGRPSAMHNPDGSAVVFRGGHESRTAEPFFALRHRSRNFTLASDRV
jgi:hypothetical protein